MRSSRHEYFCVSSSSFDNSHFRMIELIENMENVLNPKPPIRVERDIIPDFPCNPGNFLRQAVLPQAVRHSTLTTLREKLIKIGAKVVRHFRTKNIGEPEDVTLIPFYKAHHERYSVYWNVVSEADWEKNPEKTSAGAETLLETALNSN
jgi:hypothetical protein